MSGPFLKWAGGKRRMLGAIVPLFERAMRHAAGSRVSFARYVEPFIGGGSVFFALRSSSVIRGKGAILADANGALIRTYEAVRDRAGEVVDVLREWAPRWSSREAYEEARAWLNAEMVLSDPVSCAVLFIFCNRTCFRGLWRMNRNGRMNTPWGAPRRDPFARLPEMIHAASEDLRGVDLRILDAASLLDRLVDRGQIEHAALYLDPPYVPVSRTSSFTAYHGGGFGLDAQRRLAASFTRAADVARIAVLSQSDTPETRELYRGHVILPVLAPRAIGAGKTDSANRESNRAAGEVLVVGGRWARENRGALLRAVEADRIREKEKRR